jgi:hypothetical protein
LREYYDLQKLRKALIMLPKTLDETYRRISENIPESNVDDATKILRLLTWSDRPTRLEEMVDAIAIILIEEPSFLLINRMPVPHEILRRCPSLITLVNIRTESPRYTDW